MSPAGAADRDQAPSRRERVRASTIEEIKQTAMQLLRSKGPDFRLADLAREVGFTAPALYRYFADRDELLSALMADGFHDLAVELTGALAGTDPGALPGRIRSVADAYRAFAKADPQRFALMFGLPNPGYVHGEHSSGPAASAAMGHLEALLRGAIDHGQPPAPLVRDVGPTWAIEAAAVQAPEGARIPADAYQSLLHFLAGVHGFACLETFDHLSWISADAKDDLFHAQVDLMVRAMTGQV